MQEKETLDEKLPGLFEPDTLLPIQYFEAMRRKHLLEGEKRLILSVLEDAVECFMKCIESPTSKGQRLFRDADEWIALEDKHWVFSFDNVCDMLDINPEYMRRGLRQWKERKIEAIERAAIARAEADAIAAQAPLDQEPAKPAEPEKGPQAAQPLAAPKTVAAPRITKIFSGHGSRGKGTPAPAHSGGRGARSLRKAHA
jgi:hypothetical protein